MDAETAASSAEVAAAAVPAEVAPAVIDEATMAAGGAADAAGAAAADAPEGDVAAASDEKMAGTAAGADGKADDAEDDGEAAPAGMRKTRVAVIFGYLGTGYQGLQKCVALGHCGIHSRAHTLHPWWRRCCMAGALDCLSLPIPPPSHVSRRLPSPAGTPAPTPWRTPLRRRCTRRAASPRQTTATSTRCARVTMLAQLTQAAHDSLCVTPPPLPRAHLASLACRSSGTAPPARTRACTPPAR